MTSLKTTEVLKSSNENEIQFSRGVFALLLIPGVPGTT